MSIDLQQLREYSLSNTDINDIFSDDTRVIAYPELKNLSNIDELFDKHGRAVILYLTQPNVGHWVAVYKNGDNIHYFDPYAEKPESPKRWISTMDNIRLGQRENYLTNLLKGSGYKVFYNSFPYQKDRADVNTCGRWVVARLLLKDLDDKEFNELVKDSDVSPDDFVSLLTYFLLGK